MDLERKIVDTDAFDEVRRALKHDARKLVFTNGCFDIIHAGHVDYLCFAREQGDVLIVGLNSDRSVRENKGANRPVNNQQDRARVLSALECVDYIVIFDEKEPASLIARIVPDVLVKGEDWAHYVSGRDVVEKNGGKVVLAPLTPGRSTTGILKSLGRE